MRALLETFLHAIRVRVAPRKRWSRKRESDYALGTLQTTRFAVVTADGRQGLSLRSYIHPTQSFPKRLLTDVTTVVTSIAAANRFRSSAGVLEHKIFKIANVRKSFQLLAPRVFDHRMRTTTTLLC